VCFIKCGYVFIGCVFPPELCNVITLHLRVATSAFLLVVVKFIVHHNYSITFTSKSTQLSRSTIAIQLTLWR